jgi:hypothetical protein
MYMDKLQHTGDLRKTAQSDNLSSDVALALQGIRALILENPSDASLEKLVDSFRRALQAYDSGINDGPVERARRFSRAARSSLQCIPMISSTAGASEPA